MNLLQLKYFQTVARMEHMTKAAEELKVSQPSLSNSIARLEKKLGVSLFIREGRQIRLSTFGKTFLQRVDRIFLELEEGVREINEMAGLERGAVSFAITMPSILPFILKDFLAIYPDVRMIQKQALTADEIKKQLKQGKIDVCISSIPVHDEDIEWLHLCEEEIFLTVPTCHPLAGREHIHLKEVAEERFIRITSEYGLRETTDEYCRAAGFEPTVSFQLADIAAIQNLVELDFGVSFTPELVSLFKKLDTVQLHIDQPVCKRSIGLAWHKSKFRSEAVEQFIQFLTDFFAKLDTKCKGV